MSFALNKKVITSIYFEFIKFTVFLLGPVSLVLFGFLSLFIVTGVFAACLALMSFSTQFLVVLKWIEDPFNINTDADKEGFLTRLLLSMAIIINIGFCALFWLISVLIK